MDPRRVVLRHRVQAFEQWARQALEKVQASRETEANWALGDELAKGLQELGSEKLPPGVLGGVKEQLKDIDSEWPKTKVFRDGIQEDERDGAVEFFRTMLEASGQLAKLLSGVKNQGE